MAMLNAYDMQWMKESIWDTLDCWLTTITFLLEKPLAQQTHYNPVLQEYTGDIEFDEWMIPAERYDAVADIEEKDKMDRKKYGDRREALLTYCIGSNHNLIPTTKMDVIIDGSGDIYYIEKIAKRIGEYIIYIRRYPEGSKPSYPNIQNIPYDGM